ncbi:MAG: type II secretion system protein [Acidobacteria bacterium]|nr:type II secretion system protein [Acidobacteriota bacterium]
MNRQKAFSLVELLISLAISIVVLGGVIATFSRMNEGIRNANKSSDLTTGMRGIFAMFQHDIYMSSKGFSDLNAYQIHYNNSAVTGENYFYSITGLTTSPSSQVTLQWFDYNMASADSNPTYAVLTEDGKAASFTSSFPALLFCSTILDDPRLSTIAQGDVYVIYNGDLLYEYDWTELRDNMDPTTGLIDETAHPIGAGIVEVESVSDGVIPDPYNAGPKAFKTAKRVQFRSSGTFGNSFTVNLGTPYVPPQPLGTYMAGAVESPSASGNVRFPPDSWFARKVGTLDTFHRVTYRLDSDTIIRTENNQDMILSTEISNFRITVGLSDATITDAWTGSASSDSSDWVTDESDMASSSVAKELLGKHAYALRVELEKRSLFKDTSDTNADGSGGALKSRKMSQTFKVKNAHIPLANK